MINFLILWFLGNKVSEKTTQISLLTRYTVYTLIIQQTQNILHTVRLPVHTNLLERVKKHHNYLEHLIQYV